MASIAGGARDGLHRLPVPNWAFIVGEAGVTLRSARGTPGASDMLPMCSALMGNRTLRD